MSENGAPVRHTTRTGSPPVGLRTHHLVALLLSSHPPLTLLWVVVPTAFMVSRVVATPLVFGFAGLILFGFVLGYSGLGRRIRHAGGLYVQVTSGLGRSVGLGAATLLFVSYIGLVSASYGLAEIVLKSLISAVFGISVPLVGALLFTVGLIQCLSLASLRTLARSMIVAIGVQLLLVGWIAWTASSALHSQADGTVSTESLDPGWLLSGSFVVALLFALTGFVGSEGATVYSGELVDPHNSIPKATYLSYAVTTVVLVLGAWAVSGVVGPEAESAGGGTDPLAIFTSLVGSGTAGAVLHLLGFAAYLGVVTTAVTLNNNAARQVAGLARDGVLPRTFLASDAGTAPPARRALMVQPIASGIVALLGTFSPQTALPLWLSIGSGLGVLAVLALASAAAAVWFLVGEADESGFLGWEGQVVAGVFSVLLIGVVFGYGVTHIRQVAPGSPAMASWLVGALIAGTFAVGVVGAQLLRTRRPAVFAAIGGPRVRDERLAPPHLSSVVPQSF